MCIHALSLIIVIFWLYSIHLIILFSVLMLYLLLSIFDHCAFVFDAFDHFIYLMDCI